MKLSENFDLEEFTVSETADRKGIDNSPSGEVIFNLTALVRKLLQPLRSLYGKPMHINSGYRCPELNKAVGGVKTSQHRLGMAADVRCENPKELYALLKASGLRFDQCGIYKTFLHLSYNPEEDANRMMTFKGNY